MKPRSSRANYEVSNSSHSLRGESNGRFLPTVIPMKLVSNIAGVLLGLVLNVFALNFFFHFFQMPPPPAGSPAALFLGAMIPTGYFAFVKVLEISGGILVAIPRTRPLGLLIVSPIAVNFLCFHIFLLKGAGIFPALIVAVLSLFLLWVNRAAFWYVLPFPK
jgi:putative oxidoreductase